MLFRTAQRLLGLVILAFAVLGFVSVPIFDDTGLGHVKRFLGSDEAEALKERVEDWAEARETATEDTDEPLVHRKPQDR